MPMLNCYVDDQTMEVLEREAKSRGVEPEILAEAAIANEASQVRRRAAADTSRDGDYDHRTVNTPLSYFAPLR